MAVGGEDETLLEEVAAVLRAEHRRPARERNVAPVALEALAGEDYGDEDVEQAVCTVSAGPFRSSLYATRRAA